MIEEQKLIEYAINNKIDYAEKAAQANMEGKVLELYNGVLVVKDKVLSFDGVKVRKIEEINRIYEEKANFVKVGTPESEVLTWDIQKNEAEAYVNDKNTITPFIDRVSQSRKISREDLIYKILEKVSAFNAYMADITGKRQFYEDRVNTSKTIGEISQIIWE